MQERVYMYYAKIELDEMPIGIGNDWHIHLYCVVSWSSREFHYQTVQPHLNVRLPFTLVHCLQFWFNNKTSIKKEAAKGKRKRTAESDQEEELKAIHYRKQQQQTNNNIIENVSKTAKSLLFWTYRLERKRSLN